jgi:hypothetical protein
MIFVFPRGLFALEKAEQPATADLLAGGLDQERAAPTLADDGVNFAEQVFG